MFQGETFECLIFRQNNRGNYLNINWLGVSFNFINISLTNK